MKPTRWLTDEQRRAWISYIRGSQVLDREVDQQLRQDAGLTHAEWEILSRLSEAPKRRLRMGALAGRIVAPKSRLTHQIDRLVARGLVRREQDANDHRGVDAVLTPAGTALLRKTAPGHLATVRAHFVDLLSPEDLTALGRIMQQIADQIGATTQPSTDAGSVTHSRPGDRRT
jgi:DNA-binding MarR family transcriptional regulator